MESKRSSAEVVLVGQIPPPYSGQAIMIQNLIHGLRKHMDVEHVHMSYSRGLEDVGGFRLGKIRTLFSVIRQTRRALKRNHEAVVYYPPASPAWMPVLRDVLFLLGIRSCGAVTVFHYHAFGLPEFVRSCGLLRRAFEWAYGVADVAVAPARSCEVFNAHSTEIIPCGIDVPESFRTRKKKSHSTLRVLFVGIHTEGKGIFDVIRTARKLVDVDVPVEVRCVGRWKTAKEKNRADHLVAQLGVQEQVRFCGECTGDRLWEQYAWADVLFFPTQYALETQGMVAVEAMAFGLPVVASRWHGPEDVVVDQETGFLCAPGDIPAYAAALRRLSEEDDLRCAMGEAGQKRYETLYTQQRYIESWVRLIRTVKDKAS